MIADAEWRCVPNHPSFYVSSLGDVRRRINATHPERRQFHVLKQQVDKDGYRRICLDGKKWAVSRLVYSIFNGELVDGLVVCHMDNDRSNNSAANLEQHTQAVNISHKIAHGTHQIGDRHARSLYTNEQASRVASELSNARRSATGRLAKGEALRIAAICNVSHGLVRDISCGKTWRHAA